ARSLRSIAEGGRDVLYRGELAERIVAFSGSNGGLLEMEDLARHRSTWVEPISADYRGYRLYEMPPNTQGLAALIPLEILEQFDLADPALTAAERAHLRIEAVKLAFVERSRWVCDPAQVAIPLDALLDADYARQRAMLIDRHRAIEPPAGAA